MGLVDGACGCSGRRLNNEDPSGGARKTEEERLDWADVVYGTGSPLVLPIWETAASWWVMELGIQVGRRELR
jgi:hypothetical protein